MCMKAYKIQLSLYYYIERKEELQKLQKNLPEKNNNACEQQPTTHPHTFKSDFRSCVNSNSNPKSQKPSHCIAMFSFWGKKKIH